MYDTFAIEGELFTEEEREEFESEQDGATEVLAVSHVAVETRRRIDQQSASGRGYDPEHDDRDASGIDDHADGFHSFLEIHDAVRVPARSGRDKHAGWSGAGPAASMVHIAWAPKLKESFL